MVTVSNTRRAEADSEDDIPDSVSGEARCRVALIRGQRGVYGWRIAIGGDDLDSILDEIRETDRRLRDEYA